MAWHICTNKICFSLLIFVNRTTRLERVSELRWELGNQLPEDIKERLSPEEIAFHGEHCSILAEYMESIGCLDITGVKV